METHFDDKETGPLRILISGASGLVGSHLHPVLTTAGHNVVTLVRRPPRTDSEIQWNPETGLVDASQLEGFDVAVHLSGESIAGRWTAEKKAAIRKSRVDSTRLLAQTLSELCKPPCTLISASAVGFYGDRGDSELTEEASKGEGFLPDVAEAWEGAASAAQAAGIRVVHPRFGVILSTKGGALTRLLPLARAGMAGPIGSGTQFIAWVSLDDVVHALLHLMTHEELKGPVNVVAPEPIRQRDFARTLAAAVARPAVFPTPRFLVRMFLGSEAADAMLLASQRVIPAKLLASRYAFRLPSLSEALRHLLGRKDSKEGTAR